MPWISAAAPLGQSTLASYSQHANVGSVKPQRPPRIVKAIGVMNLLRMSSRQFLWPRKSWGLCPSSRGAPKTARHFATAVGPLMHFRATEQHGTRHAITAPTVGCGRTDAVQCVKSWAPALFRRQSAEIRAGGVPRIGIEAKAQFSVLPTSSNIRAFMRLTG